MSPRTRNVSNINLLSTFKSYLPSTDRCPVIMDPVIGLTIVSSVASGVYRSAFIVLHAYQFVIRSRLGKVLNRNSYQNQRFGRAIGLLLAVLWVNTDRLEESERRLCNLDDASLLKWRDSYVTIFNVIPVAVSRGCQSAIHSTDRVIGSDFRAGRPYWLNASRY